MSLMTPSQMGGFASIGGSATPFRPIMEPSLIDPREFTRDCREHMGKTRRRKTRTSHIPFYLQAASYRLGQLFCRTGFHLQLHEDGRVNGTKRDDSPFGVLEFLSVAIGLVSIRGKSSQRFLCMNRGGDVYGSPNYTKDCVFLETMQENYYNTYTSCAYTGHRKNKNKNQKWFVGLTRRGRARRGRSTRKKKRYTNFLVLHLDVKEFKRKPWPSLFKKGLRTRYGLDKANDRSAPLGSKYYRKLWRQIRKHKRTSRRRVTTAPPPTRLRISDARRKAKRRLRPS